MIKYLASVIVLTLIIVALVFAGKKTEIATPTKSKLGIINQELVFAKIKDKEYKIADLLGKLDPSYELNLYSELEEALKNIFAEKHFIRQAGYEPTDEKIRDFYDRNNLSDQSPYAAIKDTIKEYLINEKNEELLNSQYAKAKQEGKVKISLKKPVDLTKFSLNQKAVSGNPAASVVLVEFSDVQCPFCARAQINLAKIEEEYSSQIGIYYLHFPLSFHTEAKIAANALECAKEQNQFKALKPRLFDNQQELKVPDIIAIAKNIAKLNQDQFSQCLNSNKYLAKVEEDFALGQSVNVSGTPTVFIGHLDKETNLFQGESVVGARSADYYRELLDKYLANK